MCSERGGRFIAVVIRFYVPLTAKVILRRKLWVKVSCGEASNPQRQDYKAGPDSIDLLTTNHWEGQCCSNLDFFKN